MTPTLEYTNGTPYKQEKQQVDLNGSPSTFHQFTLQCAEGQVTVSSNGEFFPSIFETGKTYTVTFTEE